MMILYSLVGLVALAAFIGLQFLIGYLLESWFKFGWATRYVAGGNGRLKSGTIYFSKPELCANGFACTLASVCVLFVAYFVGLGVIHGFQGLFK